MTHKNWLHKKLSAFSFSKIPVSTVILIWILSGTLSALAGDLARDAVDWPSFLQRHDLVWNRLPKAWSDAAFLGNGKLAVSMYAEPGTNALRFTTDRTDV